MIKIELYTTNFHFEAYADTPARAKKVLLDGLLRHAEQYGLEKDWWHKYEDEIYMKQIEIGQAYRDNEILKEKA